MTADEHIAEAEYLLRRADALGVGWDIAASDAARASAHALLALVIIEDAR